MAMKFRRNLPLVALVRIEWGGGQVSEPGDPVPAGIPPMTLGYLFRIKKLGHPVGAQPIEPEPQLAQPQVPLSDENGKEPGDTVEVIEDVEAEPVADAEQADLLSMLSEPQPDQPAATGAKKGKRGK